MKCLNAVVKTGVNELHMNNQKYLENLELIINTMVVEYSLGCVECLEVCPINKRSLIKTF